MPPPPPPPRSKPAAGTNPGGGPARAFRAPTLREALVQVRDALGSDAVVLRTRRLRRRGVLGIGAKEIVEVVAEAGKPAAAAGRPREPNPAGPAEPAALTPPSDPEDEAGRAALQATLRQLLASDLSGTGGTGGTDSTSSDASFPAPGSSSPATPTRPAAGDLIRRTYAPPPAAPPPAAPPPAAPPRPAPPPPVRPTAAAEPAVTQRLIDEVAELRGLVERLTRQTQPNSQPQPRPASVASNAETAAPSTADPVHADALARLIEQEVAEELAAAMLTEAPPDGPQDDEDPHDRSRRALVQRLRSLTVADPDALLAVPTLALVGPTGVGKTTTLAKMAAAAKLRQGRAVGLITLDTYRIAAADQLRTYADILAVPMEVARTPDQAAAAARRLRESGVDLVLIDTAGRSPADPQGLTEVRAQLEAVGPAATHLVLSSTGSDASTRRVAEAFQPLTPTHLTFTKTDEAWHHGVVLNAAESSGLPLAYLGSGQAVPDDLQPATSEAVASLILSGPAAAGGGGGKPEPEWRPRVDSV